MKITTELGTEDEAISAVALAALCDDVLRAGEAAGCGLVTAAAMSDVAKRLAGFCQGGTLGHETVSRRFGTTWSSQFRLVGTPGERAGKQWPAREEHALQRCSDHTGGTLQPILTVALPLTVPPTRLADVEPADRQALCTSRLALPDEDDPAAAEALRRDVHQKACGAGLTDVAAELAFVATSLCRFLHLSGNTAVHVDVTTGRGRLSLEALGEPGAGHSLREQLGLTAPSQPVLRLGWRASRERHE